MELARRIDAKDVVAHALNNVGTSYLGLGEIERGLAMLRESVDLALALNLPHDACRAYLSQAEHLRHLAQYEEARSIYKALIDYAHEYRIQLFSDSGKVHLAELDWLTGNWAQVLDELDAIKKIATDEQASGYARLVATRLQGLLFTDLGQTATALEVLQQGLPIARRSHELQTTFDHLGRLARVHAQRGQPQETERLLQELLDWAEQTTYLHADNCNTLLLAVRWSAQQDRATLRSRAQDQLERAADHYQTPEALACLAEACGIVALAAGDPEAAVPELGQAAEKWEALGRSYDRTRALLDLAQAQRALGQAAAAEESLVQARAQVDVLARQLEDSERRAAFLERSELAQALAAWPDQTAAEKEVTPRQRTGQRVQFCTASDGVHIAYATIGRGPILVKAANWLSHLEYDWGSPVWRHWLNGLSQDHTLVRYDRRGCGLSDWEVEDLSLDAYVADLEAVVAHQGLDRFPLLALSGGGAVAISYAVRHPEKVSRLILYGAYSRGVNGRNSPAEVEQAQTSVRLIRLGWGQDNPAFRQFFTSLFLPEGSQEAMRWFNELQRVSSSAENAARISEAAANVDVSHLLDKVQAPTLILHADEDAVVPYSEGRHLAARIPGARFVTLHSKNHILLADEPAWPRFLTEVRRFLQDDDG
ncbi:MAG: alpha/beta fold hydrolase [Candidatus Promineifilaceae bacterium]|nr:alpha/beta fold hydrolase [Candidatus Promineifilaceae bacterium]